jgi:hypothetical protein
MKSHISRIKSTDNKGNSHKSYSFWLFKKMEMFFRTWHKSIQTPLTNIDSDNHGIQGNKLFLAQQFSKSNNAKEQFLSADWKILAGIFPH